MNAAARDALNKLNDRLRRCDRIDGLLTEVSSLLKGGAETLYDPVKDKITIQLSGELARRLRAHTDDEPVF